MRTLLATFVLGLAALLAAIATRSGEPEPVHAVAAPVEASMVSVPSDPPFAERTTPPPEERAQRTPAPTEGFEFSRTPDGVVLLSDAQRRAIAEALNTQALGDPAAARERAADAAASFSAAVDLQWWAHRRWWSAEPGGGQSGAVLFAALRELPAGLESGSVTILATPCPSGAKGAVSYECTLPSLRMVEVRFGHGAWNFELVIREDAVPRETWDAFRRSKGTR